MRFPQVPKSDFALLTHTNKFVVVQRGHIHSVYAAHALLLS